MAVDVRTGSPRFGRYTTIELAAEGPQQMWIPPGFAHGFCILGEHASCIYKCTVSYDPASEKTIR